MARAVTTSGNPGFVYFYPTRERVSSAAEPHGYCARDGSFGASVTALRPYALSTAGFAEKDIMVFGVERPTATLFQYIGPRGSRIYSPITTLIEYADSQAAVKHGLGLDSGVFALSTDPDLTLFDPVTASASIDEAARREGARVAAANLRALTMVVGFEAVTGRGLYQPYNDYIGSLSFERVGKFLKARNAFVFDNAVMADLLASQLPAGTYRSDVMSAAAHLVDAYAAAIGTQIDSDAAAAQFRLGLSGYLRLELSQLLAANTADAATAALAVTAPEIITRTAIFRETIPFPTAGYFFPGPDFFVGTSGTPLEIRAIDVAGVGSITIASNDFYANGPTGSIGFFPGSSKVTGVSVPAANASALSATLSSATGLITVNALGGFKGVSYFDYAVEHPSGETGIARVYVTFR